MGGDEVKEEEGLVGDWEERPDLVDDEHEAIRETCQARLEVLLEALLSGEGLWKHHVLEKDRVGELLQRIGRVSPVHPVPVPPYGSITDPLLCHLHLPR